jgi:putative transposase
MLRNMLRYKSECAGVWFGEVDEGYTTQDCSGCGCRGGPKGVEGLGVRDWTCGCCGSHHDRDVNAARNVLHRGLAML